MTVALWQGIGGFVARGDNFAGNHAPWASLANFDWIALNEHDPFLDLELTSARNGHAYAGKLLLWIIGTGDPVADAERAYELTLDREPDGVVFEMEAPYKGNPNGSLEERARFAAARKLAAEWRRRRRSTPTAAATLARERYFDYVGVLTAGFRILPECYQGNGATPVPPAQCVQAISDIVDRYFVHPIVSSVPRPLSERVRELLHAQTVGCSVFTIDALAGWARQNTAEWAALPAGPPVVAYR